MWKVLVADDEAKIRRGIIKTIQWEDLDMNVCGAAGNGEEALRLVEEKKPDICLLDICMPLMDGLNLADKVREIDENIICIIITGYDDFQYARKAIGSGVFAYILKPINEKELFETLRRAKDRLEKNAFLDAQLEGAKTALKKNMAYIRERFINDIIQNNISREEIQEMAGIYQLDFKTRIAVMQLFYSKELGAGSSGIYDNKLFEFVMRNVMEEILNNYGCACSMVDPNGCLLALAEIGKEENLQKAQEEIGAVTFSLLKCEVSIKTAFIASLEELGEVYQKWEEETCGHLSEAVLSAKEYIDRNYVDMNVSVQEIAYACGINSSYLTRLFHMEMGSSVVKYLTKVRILKSIDLLLNTDLHIYEIADQVGYSSQHYFCVAFKKMLGVSPKEYKQNVKQKG